jgi:hypothetical protein
LKAGWHLPLVRGGIFPPDEIARSGRKCCKSRLQENFIDFHANEPVTGKRQLSKGATP